MSEGFVPIALEIGGQFGVMMLEKSTILDDLTQWVMEKLNTDKFALHTDLGDHLVDISSKEEFEFLLDCYANEEGMNMPMNIKVKSTSSKVDLSYSFDDFEKRSIWIGNINESVKEDELIQLFFHEKLGVKVEMVQFGNISSSPTKAQFAIVNVLEEDKMHVVKKALNKKINGMALGVAPLTGKTGGTSNFFSGLTVRNKPRGRRATVIRTVVHMKSWKAEYLKRCGKGKLDKIAKETNVEVFWVPLSVGTLEISARNRDVKTAKRHIEELISGLQASSHLTYPCQDRKHMLRLTNYCRILEQTYDMALLIDNTAGTDQSGNPLFRVQVVAYDMDNLVEIVKKKLMSQPRKVFEKKVKMRPGQLDALKQVREENPQSFVDFKNEHKLKGLRIGKRAVFLKMYNRDHFEAAKDALLAMVPQEQPVVAEAETVEAETAEQAETTHGPLSPVSLPEFVPRDTDEAVEEVQWPRSSSVAEPVADEEFATELLAPETAAAPEEPDVTEEEAEDAHLFPDSWEDMPKGVTKVASFVEPMSEEWEFVATRLDFAPRLLTIERIQNKVLYKEFLKEKETQKTAILWGGSGETEPRDIYNADTFTPLDHWKKASYCNVFAYSGTDGERQLFLTEVLTGGSSKMLFKKSHGYPTYLVTYEYNPK